MPKLVAPLAAAGALLWLPGQAALGKRPEHPVLGRHDSRRPSKQRTQEDTMGRTSRAGYQAWGRQLHRLLGKRQEPTVPTTHRRTVLVTLCGLALLTVSGCGGGETSAPTTASTPPPASAASQTYSSKAFVVPLTVTVDAALKSPPIRDSSHFLTWDAGASEENKIRFLVPVVVFRAGKETPQAPPKDYLKYLMAQAKDGAVFSNVTKITVDGRPATLMNTTTYDPEGFLSGLLGCIERVSNKHKDPCYGIQPGYSLRLAVIDVGDTTLLAWSRSLGVVPDKEFFAMFERMLQSVRFR
jgi:hypothetical protein